MEISVLADVKPLLGEGPLWDAEAGRLYFVDALGRRVFRCTEHGAEMRAWTVPSRVGAVALWDGQGLVAALADGFWRLDLESGACDLLVRPDPVNANTALNDGKVDPMGRFVCGSMDLGEEHPTGALWRLEPDRTVTCLGQGIICSNGPCWSPDGSVFYFADSFTGEIGAWDHDPATGEISGRRTFYTVPDERGGAPDGATVDEEGAVWSVAVFDGRIRRLSPEGEVLREIEMPVRKVTSVAWGGAGLDRLFVTSMAEPPLPRYPGDGQLRGSLFVIDGLGVRGRPEPRFAGGLS
ncbi:MAG: SMP-30/gluconolactonase/LRE family protein [Rubellimicrobium sp.]|nr:SMP-30/gluconolactonase/LRE family protein [Rubellimicrobium sp.]